MMKTIHTYTINGQPRPMPRPRIARSGRAYMPKKCMDDIERMRIQLRAQRQMDPELGPVKLTARFFFRRPKSMKTKRYPPEAIEKANRPDLDNCFKTIADAANKILYADDCQIQAFTAAKFYCAIGSEPHTILTIETWR